MTDQRESWDRYFLKIASQVATRATCVKRQIGAVVVKDRRIQATGYNGSPTGYPHCLDGWCPRAHLPSVTGGSYDGCIAIHAEANALLQCGVEEKKGATLYCTDPPCFGCAKLIAGAGIQLIVVGNWKNAPPDWGNTAEFLGRLFIDARGPTADWPERPEPPEPQPNWGIVETERRL